MLIPMEDMQMLEYTTDWSEDAHQEEISPLILFMLIKMVICLIQMKDAK